MADFREGVRWNSPAAKCMAGKWRTTTIIWRVDKQGLALLATHCQPEDRWGRRHGHYLGVLKGINMHSTTPPPWLALNTL
jgi:hypothetical protein